MGDTSKQFSLQNFRPEGFQYPIGLTPYTVASNAATNTTGGDQTIDGSNAVHTFSVSGTFTPSFTGTVEYLVIAGGGGGGTNDGGGGGAGGLRYASGYPVTASSPYTATVGGGGGPASGAPQAGDGTNSVFGSLTAIGGGRGGSAAVGEPGQAGGSGGGSAGNGNANGAGTTRPVTTATSSNC